MLEHAPQDRDKKENAFYTGSGDFPMSTLMTSFLSTTQQILTVKAPGLRPHSGNRETRGVSTPGGHKDYRVLGSCHGSLMGLSHSSL